MGITTGKVVRYTIFPALIPRMWALLGGGFSHFSFLLAYVYSNVGLLPKNHPYLDQKNYGRFGVRHVVAQAAKNLVYSKDNIDKIVVFYIVLFGIVLLLMQILLVFISLFSVSAFAGTFFQVFNLTNPTGTAMDLTRYRQDIAFVTLDRLFGLRTFNGAETFFRSCLTTAGSCEDIRGETMAMPATIPNAFHSALHRLFGFYSMGIAFLSMVMVLYCVLAIVGETVVTGTPFGKRFNRAWFIPRLILFFAMIIPMNLGVNGATVSNSGINAAQFITLGAAKFGSNMATNAWNRFAETLLLGEGMALVAKPNVPELAQFTQFMYVVRMCMYAEMILNNKIIYPYVVRNFDPVGDAFVNLYPGISGPVLPGITFMPYAPSTFSFRQAVEFSRFGTVTVRFGELNIPSYVTDVLPGFLPNTSGGHENSTGFVEPTCGELVFNIESTSPYIIGDASAAPPILGIQENYYNMIEDYLTTDDYADRTAYCMLSAIVPFDHGADCVDTNEPSPRTGAATGTQWLRANALAQQSQMYDMLVRQRVTGDYISNAGAIVNNIAGTILDRMRTDYSPYVLPPEIRERGWVGAALWYNRVAEINGMMFSGLKNIPSPYLYPLVMEMVAAQHKAEDAQFSYSDRFNPLLQSGRLATLRDQGDQYKAAALYAAYNFWETSQPTVTPHNRNTNNFIMDAVNLLLGTNGILDIRDNIGVHPLAMLSALGKGMVDAALNNMFYGGVGLTIGAASSKNFPGFSDIAKAGGSFYMRMMMIGFSIGFVLYYVLPLMPFIYFFFAFSGWVKSIFEAMVAMPLWAVAHIKIDGNGLPGPLASNGYYLLLEIFVRPTLIVVGFISSISIYAAMVDVLHDSFSSMILNAGGTNVEKMLTDPANHNIAFMMGPVNELFYTVMYVIFVYMIGISCFKLIDLIPGHIMRWMGVTVSTFREGAGDPASELQAKMYRSSQTSISQLQSMMSGTADTLTNTQIIQGSVQKAP